MDLETADLAKTQDNPVEVQSERKLSDPFTNNGD